MPGYPEIKLVNQIKPNLMNTKKTKPNKKLFPSAPKKEFNSRILASEEGDLVPTNLNASNIITGIWDSIEEEMKAA